MRIGRAIIIPAILALGLAGPAVYVAAAHAPSAHTHVVASSTVYHHE
jgi:hypothetical protein